MDELVVYFCESCGALFDEEHIEQDHDNWNVEICPDCGKRFDECVVGITVEEAMEILMQHRMKKVYKGHGEYDYTLTKRNFKLNDII